MGRKALKKKRAHVAFCREQVRQGLINGADGTWTRPQSTSAMWHHMQAGYRLGEFARGRRKKASSSIEVEG